MNPTTRTMLVNAAIVVSMVVIGNLVTPAIGKALKVKGYE